MRKGAGGYEDEGAVEYWRMYYFVDSGRGFDGEEEGRYRWHRQMDDWTGVDVGRRGHAWTTWTSGQGRA